GGSRGSTVLELEPEARRGVERGEPPGTIADNAGRKSLLRRLCTSTVVRCSPSVVGQDQRGPVQPGQLLVSATRRGIGAYPGINGRLPWGTCRSRTPQRRAGFQTSDP